MLISGSLVPVITTHPISGGSVEDCVNKEKGQLTRFLSYVSKATQRDDKLTHLSFLWGRGNVINIVLNWEILFSYALLNLKHSSSFSKKKKKIWDSKRMWLLSRFEYRFAAQCKRSQKNCISCKDGTRQSFWRLVTWRLALELFNFASTKLFFLSDHNPNPQDSPQSFHSLFFLLAFQSHEHAFERVSSRN